MGVHCPFIGVENFLNELIFSILFSFQNFVKRTVKPTVKRTVKDMNNYVVTLTLILITIYHMVDLLFVQLILVQPVFVQSISSNANLN